MRIFQNSALYRSYRRRLRSLTRHSKNFDDATRAFLADRFGAAHFLQPVLSFQPEAFFANGDDELTQRMWARENGIRAKASLEDILLAQIEHHRAEVFYNMDPMRYGDEFLRKLPGCVVRTVAWRAAPSAGGNFLAHDVIVNNFPSILESYRQQGVRAEYLAPGHDPEMDSYAARRDRPIDVLFVGTFSRHHRIRTAMLEAIAAMQDRLSIVFHLDVSRYTRLAETPLGLVGPLQKDRRSAAIRSVARTPVFGRDLLSALGSAQIVVNGAIDMAGADRGNMRVWEALGCRSALISDRGQYPPGIIDGTHFIGYDDPEEVPMIIERLIRDSQKLDDVASAGNKQIRNMYSKQIQWDRFTEIVG